MSLQITTATLSLAIPPAVIYFGPDSDVPLMGQVTNHDVLPSAFTNIVATPRN